MNTVASRYKRSRLYAYFRYMQIEIVFRQKNLFESRSKCNVPCITAINIVGWVYTLTFILNLHCETPVLYIFSNFQIFKFSTFKSKQVQGVPKVPDAFFELQ